METENRAISLSSKNDWRERIDHVFSAQMQHHWHVARSTARERKQKLRSMLKWILDHRADIRAALQADFQKPATETDLTEILVVTSEIRHAVRNLHAWMRPRAVEGGIPFLTTSGEVRFEPRGVVLIVAPWNFPFNLTAGPLVSAIAAGNCVILKPSEYTPATSAVVGRMISDLFPENEVAMIEGDAEVASALLDRPFHHIFFTGSPAVGKIVQRKAAEHLTSVTLELGGKSPAIVDQGCDLGDAVKKIVWGKFVNNGQTCIAPDYALVHESCYDVFLEKAAACVRQYYGESEEDRLASPDYARIISQRHHARLVALVDASVKQGARVVCGGNSSTSELYLSPTILADVPEHAPVMQEEIFGPVLPVMSVPSLHAAIEIVRKREKPLALYLFTRRKKHVDLVLAETSAGGTCVNDTLIHFLHPELPFGGVNYSGSGNAHGFYGFRAFSHERSVLRHHRLAPMKMLYPPYTPFVRRVAELFSRFF